MPKPVSRRELIQKLHRLGFAGLFRGGRHQFMERRGFKITIPNPHGKDIGAALLAKILRDIGISSTDFERL